MGRMLRSLIWLVVLIFLWRCGRKRAMASSCLRFLDHTQWPTTVGKIPLDDRSVRRRDLYLTTHNTHNRQTSIFPAGFEPNMSAGERPLGSADGVICVSVLVWLVCITTDLVKYLKISVQRIYSMKQSSTVWPCDLNMLQFIDLIKV